MFELLTDPQKSQPPQDSEFCECLEGDRSTLDRPALWLPVVLGMFVSTFVVFGLADYPGGLELASIIPYTALVALGSFSAQRGMQPYFFECPFVRRSMPQLFRRHGIFVAVIVAIESIAQYLSGSVSGSWLTASGRDGSHLNEILVVTCIALGCVEAYTNRTFLEQAHAELAARLRGNLPRPQ